MILIVKCFTQIDKFSMYGISELLIKKIIMRNKDDIITINNLAITEAPDGEGYYHGNNLSFGHRR